MDDSMKLVLILSYQLYTVYHGWVGGVSSPPREHEPPYGRCAVLAEHAGAFLEGGPCAGYIVDEDDGLAAHVCCAHELERVSYIFEARCSLELCLGAGAFYLYEELFYG